MDFDDALTSLRRLLNSIVDSRNPFYAQKLGEAGFTVFDELTLDEFRHRCPFTTKHEIAADHHANPPFGTNLGKPVGMYSRVCKTSGTTGERIMWPDTQSGWDAMLEVWQKIYHSEYAQITTSLGEGNWGAERAKYLFNKQSTIDKYKTKSVLEI